MPPDPAKLNRPKPGRQPVRRPDGFLWGCQGYQLAVTRSEGGPDRLVHHETADLVWSKRRFRLKFAVGKVP